MKLMQSPSQTVGPFFQGGLFRGKEHVLTDELTLGERIRLTGQVLDGEGKPVTDAVIEIWQADARGHFNHPADPDCAQADPHFRGFGRSNTEDDGRFEFLTVKPGPAPGRGGAVQASHVDVRIFARGMLIHAVTRLYFADEPANASDAVLNSVAPARRPTLIAALERSGGEMVYYFDIHLQGARETVFFEP